MKTHTSLVEYELCPIVLQILDVHHLYISTAYQKTIPNYKPTLNKTAIMKSMK